MLAWSLLPSFDARDNRARNRGNTMKSTRLILAGLMAIGIAAGFALSAQATQINGTIGFTSAPNANGGALVNNGGGSFTLNFSNPQHVDFGNGDYTGTVGTTATFAPITFTNGGGLTSTNTPEWTFTIGATTYSFDLLSLMTATFHVDPITHVSALTLMGDGTVHITGLEDTEAIFALE